MPFRKLSGRLAGLALMTLGVFALFAPLLAGRWSLAILGIPLIALSFAEAYAAIKSSRRSELSAYLPSALALCARNLLLLSSALVLSGLLILLFAILVADGLSKIWLVRRKLSEERGPALISALIDFVSAALLWYLSRGVGAERAVGLIVGILVMAAGWRMFMAPPDSGAVSDEEALNIHPDPGSPSHRTKLSWSFAVKIELPHQLYAPRT